MSNLSAVPHQPSLRQIVLAASGQDLRRCRSCWLCDGEVSDDLDLPFSLLVQMVLTNDAEVLTSQTVWSDEVLPIARHACTQGLNLEAALLALRAEARQCGIQGPLLGDSPYAPD